MSCEKLNLLVSSCFLVVIVLNMNIDIRYKVVVVLIVDNVFMGIDFCVFFKDVE